MSYSFRSLANVDASVVGHNDVDVEGLVRGGYARFVTVDGQTLLDLQFQGGPVDRQTGALDAIPSGVFVEDLLEICRIRLECYQDSKFACPENAEAIQHVKAAVKALLSRRAERWVRGVEGKDET